MDGCCIYRTTLCCRAAPHAARFYPHPAWVCNVPLPGWLWVGLTPTPGLRAPRTHYPSTIAIPPPAPLLDCRLLGLSHVLAPHQHTHSTYALCSPFVHGEPDVSLPMVLFTYTLHCAHWLLHWTTWIICIQHYHSVHYPTRHAPTGSPPHPEHCPVGLDSLFYTFAFACRLVRPPAFLRSPPAYHPSTFIVPTPTASPVDYPDITEPGLRCTRYGAMPPPCLQVLIAVVVHWFIGLALQVTHSLQLVYHLFHFPSRSGLVFLLALLCIITGLLLRYCAFGFPTC